MFVCVATEQMVEVLILIEVVSARAGLKDHFVAE